jgi:SAM-dependent methyltransferase
VKVEAPLKCALCEGALRPRSSDPVMTYAGLQFRYLLCENCGSLICNPMPDARTLSRMYGLDYARQWPAGKDQGTDKNDWVLDQLRRRPPGVFLDYGCGTGGLLRKSSELNWRVFGVEFHQDVAHGVESSTSLGVLTPEEVAHRGDAWCDVLNFGDVLEHCTNPDDHLRIAFRSLKPGGILLAQGPLEANASLFRLGIRLSHRLRRSRVVSMPPYHVIQASSRGQRLLFSRNGFDELLYEVEEVAWPAPPSLTRRELRQPRSLVLFILRMASQCVTWLGPSDWGNRYRYAGSRP